MVEPAIDEGARRRFEAAWHSGEPQPIEAHAPPADDPLHAATVEELIHIELELGWRDHLARGRPPPPPIETYLARFRPLRTPGIARRLLEAELRIRARVGKPATDEDVGSRFTALFPELPAPTLGPAPDPLADEPLPGMPLGRYRLGEEHARGGMGRVWRAEDPQLGRTVAIKQLAPGLVNREELRRRFVAEARITARLEHPGVVPVYELIEGDGAPFYAMKLVRGETLTETIARARAPSTPDGERTLAFARAIEAVLAVTRTVAFAHSRGVLHRDLKPDNVVIGEFGETVLLDWGLARAIEAPPDELDGTVLGTPGYMAPEQVAGDVARIDARSDVYALGAILHHVLTGAPPGDGRAPEPSDLAPAELCSIAAIAMAPLPDDRYQDAAELAAELALYQAGQLVSAPRYTASEMIRRWIRRHRAAVITALVLVVALAAVGALAIRQTIVGRERAAANLETAIAAMIDQGRTQLAAGQHARAATILAEARRLGGDTPLLAHLLADASRAPSAARGALATGAVALVPIGGGRVAALARDGALELRDAAGSIGERIATTARTLAGSGGGRLVAAGDVLELIDASVSPARRVPLGPGKLARFSAGGRLLAVAGPTVSLRDGVSGAVIREHADAVDPDRVAISANGRVLVAGLPSGELRAWSTETGEPLGTWDLRPHGWRAFEALAVSADGAVIAAAPYTGFQVAVVRVGAPAIEPMDPPKGGVTELELDAEGGRLATSGRAHAGAIYDV
ncbi:MAG: protein kinase, partial [Myxococcales bacterium]|nr:protein kinase [Myxococcales bacterium]